VRDLPAHIKAKPGDIAESVIAVGDPDRAEQVAGILRDARLVNSNRGLLAFTGSFGGREVTVATHGLGGPSSAIVFEELRILGARTIVRLGTVGAMVKELKVGDFVIPMGAAYSEGSLRMYVPDGELPAVPDVRLTWRLADSCRRRRLSHRLGLVFSSDAFYNEDRTFVSRWAARGVVGVEMECATLFTLGLLKGFRAASLLIVSDSLVRKGETEVVAAEGLRPFVKKGAKAVLGALSP
jgi:5'-methylthioadenosine phosphorylase